jgi:hypothetical protein
MILRGRAIPRAISARPQVYNRVTPSAVVIQTIKNGTMILTGTLTTPSMNTSCAGNIHMKIFSYLVNSHDLFHGRSTCLEYGLFYPWSILANMTIRELEIILY